jgi:quinol monooxygenase YgiN
MAQSRLEKPPTQMITSWFSEIHLIASMVALPGKEDELREVLRLSEPTQNEPGNRRYDMYASDQRGRFFAIDTWESRRALDKHKQTPHFKAAAASLSELLQRTLALDILDPIVQ